MVESNFSFSHESWTPERVTMMLPRTLASPFQDAFSGETYTPPELETEAWPPPALEANVGEPEAAGRFDGEDETVADVREYENPFTSGETFVRGDFESFEGEAFAWEAAEGNGYAGAFETNPFDGECAHEAASEVFEAEGVSEVGLCTHCGGVSRATTQFEHAVPALRSVTRDYSLKGIADNDKLPDDVRAAILRDGQADVYELSNRAFKLAHPEITGPIEKLGSRHSKARLAYRAIAKQVRSLIWLRQVIDELDKTRGTLPREFLLGWMAVESDGIVSTRTKRPEHGYFQIDWLKGEAKEQLGLTRANFDKLSTDRVFSIQQGIRLAEKYRQWVLKRYPSVADDSEILWRLTKGRHAASGALKTALDVLVSKKVNIDWSEVSKVVPEFMRKNMDSTWNYATKFKPFVTLVGSALPDAPAGAKEFLESSDEAKDNEAFEQVLNFGVVRDYASREYEGVEGEASEYEASEYEASEYEASEYEASAYEDLGGEDEWQSSGVAEVQDESAPLLPGFVHATLPFREAEGPLEEYQTTAPKGLVELAHRHVPKTVSATTAGSFSVGVLGPLKTDDLNPLFVDASDNLIADKSSTGIQTCLTKLMASKYSALLGSRSQTAASLKDRVRVAVVDLSGHKLTKPELAGWGSTVPIYGASVPKVLALYGAFQLRSDLREMATRLSPSNGTQLQNEAIKEWKAKGAKAPWPDLNWLFDIGKWTPSAALDFTPAAKTAMSKIKDNCPAGTLIAKVSFQFIGSLAWQSGLFHGTRSGLWLKAAYCGKGVWSSPVKAPYSANATALSCATYFTLLAQGRLVDDAASKDITTALAHGCVTSLLPSLPVVASKCGIWNGYVHDTAWVQDTQVRYAIAVMSKLSTGAHAALYTQLCSDLDQLIRNNNKSPKVSC